MRSIVERLLGEADIRVNGDRPWDITVHDSRFYRRLLADGSLGIGESYMDGDWDCEQLDEAACKIFRSRVYDRVRQLSWRDKLQGLQARAMNMQSRWRSFQVGQKHYDVGNELYEVMLGKSMAYACAYWRNGARTLDEAQEAKFDLICRKIGLAHGDSVLDLGCGWGTLLRYMAQLYSVNGVGVTVSKEQVQFANASNKGLPVSVFLQDYRDPILDAAGDARVFDHVVSVGFCEHVGPKNYRPLMEVADAHLKPGGLFLLHTIGQATSARTNDPWTHKYIFPNSQAPSIAQLAGAAEGIFAIEDIHVFGTDYEATTLAWHKNFNDHWNELKKLRTEDGSVKYDERFRRMWNFYLLCGAGLSRSQQATLWQVVFSRGDISGGYRSIR
jgi:cyclopropane-fatty-acyl-phospholipid synthase